ncbi:hypothetical protein CMUS01_10856 [Colletotrichum musicola]|uniref:Uncharacterized protein n=1 Tax=Colletotrichum musicola TaxID=2175873 RepID=A0A8H6K292_9PEZI|nr:hypothetical protein CMUS01_10856 [Colletotrichum musicola]
MAEQLLMEPRLSKIHQASVHLLLSTCSDNFLHHAKEAVRLSGEVFRDFEFTSEQRVNVMKMVEAAEDALRRARSDQADMDREVNRLLLVFLHALYHGRRLTFGLSASGKTMSNLHDEQFKALQEQELLAQENDAQEDGA